MPTPKLLGICVPSALVKDPIFPWTRNGRVTEDGTEGNVLGKSILRTRAVLGWIRPPARPRILLSFFLYTYYMLWPIRLAVVVVAARGLGMSSLLAFTRITEGKRKENGRRTEGKQVTRHGTRGIPSEVAPSTEGITCITEGQRKTERKAAKTSSSMLRVSLKPSYI